MYFNYLILIPNLIMNSLGGGIWPNPSLYLQSLSCLVFNDCWMKGRKKRREGGKEGGRKVHVMPGSEFPIWKIPFGL